MKADKPFPYVPDYEMEEGRRIVAVNVSIHRIHDSIDYGLWIRGYEDAGNPRRQVTYYLVDGEWVAHASYLDAPPTMVLPLGAAYLIRKALLKVPDYLGEWWSDDENWTLGWNSDPPKKSFWKRLFRP